MMFGQMTAGSWIYIGSQGIVQGTYETFAELGRQHYGGDLAGRWILTAGLGGMGGAQPLAATMAGASMLAVECDPTRIEKRLATKYLDVMADDAGTRRSRYHRRSEADEKASDLRSAYSETQPKCFPKFLRTRRPAGCRDRSNFGSRSVQRLSSRSGWSLERWNVRNASGIPRP